MAYAEQQAPSIGLSAHTTARDAIGERRLDGKTAIQLFDFEGPNLDHRPYDKMLACGQSKTANALFAVEVERRQQQEPKVVVERPA